MPSPLIRRWRLDPSVTFLNHGSYGASPIRVLERQAELRERMETQPVQFLGRDLPGELAQAKAEVARFVGAKPEDIGFVHNATSGVNTVLRSLSFAPGDELLVTNHAYNACRNALDFVAELWGAKVRVATIPFPVPSADQIVQAVLDATTACTSIALIDHVTSPTGVVFPIERIVKELRIRGVEAIVDGAHAPGMIDLDVDSFGVAYYAGNGHKWVCAPKGSAFLYVRPDLQERIRPLAISHGANRPQQGRSRFAVEFEWTGTQDPSAWLTMPAAIDVMGAMVPGGWEEVRRRNHELVLAGRRLVLDALGIDTPVPDDLIGSIASIPLPGDPPPIGYPDPLQVALRERHAIEVPVMQVSGQRVLRISAQLYNALEDYERLADAVKKEPSAQ